MRDRLLIRHFLWRFLEHDLISPNADRHVVLSAVGGALVAVSLFMAVLIATPYQFFNLMPPGIVSLSSLDDRFLFTSASMLVMALAAVAQWDALALDARDTAVLGVLPIPRGGHRPRQVRRDRAAGASAWLSRGICSRRLLRSAAVPLKLPIELRGRAEADAGARRGDARGRRLRLSRGARPARSRSSAVARTDAVSSGSPPALQARWSRSSMTALLLLPGTSRGVARRWLARGGLTSRRPFRPCGSSDCTKRWPVRSSTTCRARCPASLSA